MPRILRLYCLKEVALPTAVALLAVMLLLLVQRVFDLINLLLQPSVTAGQMAAVVGLLLPQLLVLALPMAVLIGTLVGVGRLTLDREVLAVRASGANLLSIFAPTLAAAFALSVGLWALSARLIPLSLLHGLRKAAELQFAVIDSLEPGRFHEKLAGDDSNFILYFDQRDPQTRDMIGVVIKLENDFQLSRPQSTTARRRGVSLVPAAHAAEAEPTPTPPVEVTPDEATPAAAPSSSDEAQTTIFAHRGTIRADFSGQEGGSLIIELREGTLHRLVDDARGAQYVAARFERLTKVFVFSSFLERLSKEYSTLTNAELWGVMARREQSPGSARQALRELVRRYAMAPACFVFALVGIPLAIWVRPTGKSLGIVIAVGMMFAYYMLLQWGLTLIKEGKPGGLELACAPTVAFVVLGAALWRQTLRS